MHAEEHDVGSQENAGEGWWQLRIAEPDAGGQKQKGGPHQKSRATEPQFLEWCPGQLLCQQQRCQRLSGAIQQWERPANQPGFRDCIEECGHDDALGLEDPRDAKQGLMNQQGGLIPELIAVADRGWRGIAHG